MRGLNLAIVCVIFILGTTGSSIIVFAQNEIDRSTPDTIPFNSDSVALSLDTTFTLEALVQTSGALTEVDSLWNDSIWTWTGACLSPAIMFHFRWSDGVTLLRKLSCIDTPKSSLNSSSSVNGYTGYFEATMDSLFVEAQNSGETNQKCFPPLSENAMNGFSLQMAEVIFESDKVQMAEQLAASECLTKPQARQLLLSIANEDRRMELFDSFLQTQEFWTVDDADGLFQLNFIKKQASALLNNQ
tara:strand:- start:7638 stop:8369 length:732 start_codon:yes stop_codon:yes gene_type:complete